MRRKWPYDDTSRDSMRLGFSTGVSGVNAMPRACASARAMSSSPTFDIGLARTGFRPPSRINSSAGAISVNHLVFASHIDQFGITGAFSITRSGIGCSILKMIASLYSGHALSESGTPSYRALNSAVKFREMVGLAKSRPPSHTPTATTSTSGTSSTARHPRRRLRFLAV